MRKISIQIAAYAVLVALIGLFFPLSADARPPQAPVGRVLAQAPSSPLPPSGRPPQAPPMREEVADRRAEAPAAKAAACDCGCGREGCGCAAGECQTQVAGCCHGAGRAARRGAVVVSDQSFACQGCVPSAVLPTAYQPYPQPAPVTWQQPVYYQPAPVYQPPQVYHQPAYYAPPIYQTFGGGCPGGACAGGRCR